MVSTYAVQGETAAAFVLGQVDVRESRVPPGVSFVVPGFRFLILGDALQAVPQAVPVNGTPASLLAHRVELTAVEAGDCSIARSIGSRPPRGGRGRRF